MPRESSLTALLLTRQNAARERGDGADGGVTSGDYQAHLAYQWSPEAQKAVFYPRVICPYAGNDRLEWRISAGLGTVYATTVVHPREGIPYHVALVDCDEGFRLMSRVEDIAPEAVRIGMCVRFRVHRLGDEPPYPAFVRVKGA